VIIWTLKNQLGLEHHGGRVPAGLWARIVQRMLALNAAIWHNWAIGASVKRSLIAYDHDHREASAWFLELTPRR
jgi:hypothetical protein